MYKIKDIVDIPEKIIREEEDFVIKIVDAITKEKDKTIEDFIITKNIYSSVEDIMSFMIRGKGQGFWITGFYGSGKSHLISYLTLLLSEENTWNALEAQFQYLQEELKRNGYIIEFTKPDSLKKVFSKRLVIVPFSLAYSDDFKYTLYEEVEKKLKELGIDIEIKDDNKIVSDFIEYINKPDKKGTKEDFIKFLRNVYDYSEEDWNELTKEEDKTEASQIILDFKYPEGNFKDDRIFKEKIYPSIDKGLDIIIKTIIDNGFEGIVIIADELSMYLEKRKEKGLIGSDVSVLQLIGEKCESTDRMWFLGAMQSHLRSIIGDMEYESRFGVTEQNKVRDRFKQIALSKENIREIVIKRVARKKPEMLGRIDDIYVEFEKELSKDFLSPYYIGENCTEKEAKERFIKIYPFHISVVDNITAVTEELSRTRTALKVLYQCLTRQSEKRDNELITFDVLFDNVFIRDPSIEIIDNPTLNKLHDIYYKHFEKLINENFKGDYNLLAHKLIKTLIMLKVANKTYKHPNELTYFVLKGYGMKNPILSHNNIIKVLKELHKYSGGKYITEKNGVYSISIEEMGVDPEHIITEKEKRILKENIIKQIESISMNELFPKSLFNKNKEFTFNQPVKIKDKTIYWRNSPRQGMLVFTDILNPKPIQINPHEDNCDFIVYIGIQFGRDFNDCFKKAKENIENAEVKYHIYWIPKQLSDEKYKRLVRYTAITELLYKEYKRSSLSKEDKKIKNYLLNEQNTLITDVASYIKDGFLKGTIIHSSEVEDLEQLDLRSAKEILEYIIEKPLDVMYPEHPEFIYQVASTQANALIKNFVLKLEVDEETNEMKSMGNPLSIVNRIGNRYILKQSKYTEKVIDILSKEPDANKIDVDEIYKTLRIKDGLQNFSVDVLLAVCIKLGVLRGIDKNGDVIVSDDLRDIGSLRKIKYVEKGKLIDQYHIWKNVVDIAKVLDNSIPTDQNIINQEKIWIAVKKVVNEKNTKIMNALNAIEAIETKIKDADISDTKIIVNAFKELFSDGIFTADSYNGLIGLLDEINNSFGGKSEFNSKYIVLNNILEFLDKRNDTKIEDAFTYLSGVELRGEFKTYIDTVKDLMDRLLETDTLLQDSKNFESFESDLNNFKQEYSKDYTAEHNKYHTNLQTIIKTIKESDEYKTLEILSGIEKITDSIVNNLENIDNQLKSFSASKCSVQKGIYELILKQPKCDCRYILGELIETTAEDILIKIRQGVSEYITILRSKEYGKYILRCKDLDIIYKVSPNDYSLIMQIVTEELVDSINKCLEIIKPVKISFNEVLKEVPKVFNQKDVDNVVKKFEEKLKEIVQNYPEDQMIQLI